MKRINLHLSPDILKKLKNAAEEVNKRMRRKGKETKTSTADLIRFGIAQIWENKLPEIHISGKDLSRALKEIKEDKKNIKKEGI